LILLKNSSRQNPTHRVVHPFARDLRQVDYGGMCAKKMLSFARKEGISRLFCHGKVSIGMEK
jgi:hypothetical protein